MNGNVLVVHGGGPTAVINSSLYGVIEEAKALGLDKVYAAMGGSQAILKEDFFDLLQVPEDLLKTFAGDSGNSDRLFQICAGAGRLRCYAGNLPEI